MEQKSLAELMKEEQGKKEKNDDKTEKKKEKDENKQKKPKTKSELKKELRILIRCSRSGHKRYLEYPEFDVKTPEELGARIDEIISLL